MQDSLLTHAHAHAHDSDPALALAADSRARFAREVGIELGEEI